MFQRKYGKDPRGEESLSRGEGSGERVILLKGIRDADCWETRTCQVGLT